MAKTIGYVIMTINLMMCASALFISDSGLAYVLLVGGIIYSPLGLMCVAFSD